MAFLEKNILASPWKSSRPVWLERVEIINFLNVQQAQKKPCLHSAPKGISAVVTHVLFVLFSLSILDHDFCSPKRSYHSQPQDPKTAVRFPFDAHISGVALSKKVGGWLENTFILKRLNEGREKGVILSSGLTVQLHTFELISRV